MTGDQYPSADVTLRIEVRRNRPSVTQGSATVYINGEEVFTFGDEIDLVKHGEKYYGPIIGGWASKEPDAGFICGVLFHPYDGLYHCSDKAREIIGKLCEADFPGTIKA